MRRRPRPGQGWLTFLRNQRDGIAAMDLFTVPTANSDAETVVQVHLIGPFGITYINPEDDPQAKAPR